MHHETSLLIATALYGIAALLLAVSITQASRRLRVAAILCSFAGVALHVLSQTYHWIGPGQPDVSFLNLLSLSALVIMLIICLSVFSRDSLFDAGLVFLPLAAVIVGLELGAPINTLTLEEASVGTSVHILSSVVAFGVLSIAGVYAVFIAVCDHFLKSHHLNHLVRALPPLEGLERLMFRLIGTGFVLLTVSLGSGLVFVSDLFAQHLAHKTVLTILAWLVFGILLWGRIRSGWRGRRAVRLTLAGILLLLLGYFGSKFILENVLGRDWRS